jgi:hypothetical protein
MSWHAFCGIITSRENISISLKGTHLMAPILFTQGSRFGRLVTLEDVPGGNGKRRTWLCRCDCGTTCLLEAKGIAYGRTLSCGCLKRERASNLKRRHSLANSPEYRSWAGMKSRCLNPNAKRYSDYGGRGITLWEEWLDFSAFYRDMGPRPTKNHTIERLDNDGPYAPDNCRWATKLEQAANKRNNHLIEHDGNKLSISEWVRRTGLSFSTIKYRLSKEWPSERLFEPVTRFHEVLKRPTIVPENHCPYGHALLPDNIYVAPGTNRKICKKCRAESQRRLRARRL